MIAADLTLYSNPLNRLLSGSAKTENQDGDESKKEHVSIAADMKQYTNPLAELDRFHKTEKK